MTFKPPPMQRWHKLALSGGAAMALLLGIGPYFEGAPPHVGDHAVAYWDKIGHKWTICYGETEGVQQGDVRSLSECAADFARAAKPYLAAARAALPAGSPETRVAAFGDFFYNLGIALGLRSKPLRLVKVGRIQEGCDAMLEYDHAHGIEYYGLWLRRYVDRFFCLYDPAA